MHNSFIAPNQLQNFPARKIFKETLHRFISDYVLCYTRAFPTHQLLLSALFWLPWLLGPWHFFNDQAGHWIPACCTIRVSISRTDSNVDTNTDFSLVNAFTVAFYWSRFVAMLISICHPPNDINRQWTAALGAIEGDEPSLTTFVAVEEKVSLINNTESGVIFPLVKNTILQNTKARIFITIWDQKRDKYGKLNCCYNLGLFRCQKCPSVYYLHSKKFMRTSNQEWRIKVNFNKTNINGYLDKTNATGVITLPRTLFPVSVVSVCTIFPHVSFLTSWSSGTNHTFVTFRSISTVAAW